MTGERVPARCPRCGGALRAGAPCAKCGGAAATPRPSSALAGAIPPTVADAMSRTEAAAGPPLPVAPRLPSRPIAGYVVERVLGSGGMGVVYAARKPGGPPVALKVITHNLSETARKRLARESAALARLDHPGIVKLIEHGSAPEGPWVAMELVDGATLSTIAMAVGLTLDDTLSIVEAVARAVDHAHRSGIVHRDLKPANILLTRDRRVKVVDFGLARELEPGATSLTASGSVIGTPSYMAPEQVKSQRDAIGPATDVYALGVLLYELSTGNLPHVAPTLEELLRKVVRDEVVPPTRKRPELGLPAGLDRIVGRCLAKDGALRIQSAGELADEVARLRRGEPSPPEEVQGTEGTYVIHEALARIPGGTRFRAATRDGREVDLDKISDERLADPRDVERARGLGADAGFVPILDVCAKDHALFIVRPCVARASLRERLRQPFTLAESVALGASLAASLAAAHARGVVHGRLVPEAVLLDEGGRAWVQNAGLVHVREDVPCGSQCVEIVDEDGTHRFAAYMAPEQLLGAEPGPAADVFALGAILWECIAGRPAFPGASLRAALGASAKPAADLAAASPGTPPSLARVVARALSRDASARFADAAALGAALARR